MNAPQPLEQRLNTDTKRRGNIRRNAWRNMWRNMWRN